MGKEDLQRKREWRPCKLALGESDMHFFVGFEGLTIVDISSSEKVGDTVLDEVKGSYAETDRSRCRVFFRRAGKRAPNPLVPTLLSGGGGDSRSTLLYGND